MKTLTIKVVLLLTLALSSNFLPTLASAETAMLPYPIIFVHGIEGNIGTWENSAAEIKGYSQPDFADPLVYHICLNHDRQDRTASFNTGPNGGGDVVPVGWTNVSRPRFLNQSPSPNVRLFILNFDDDDTKDIVRLVNNQPQPLNHGDHDRSNAAAIYKQGFALKLMITAVRQLTGSDKVILIGHSMGGLAIREYLQRKVGNTTRYWWIDRNSDDGHKVAKVVSLGTPHLGWEPTDEPWRFPERDDPLANTSEACRDMARNLARPGNEQIIANSIYLFGGRENQMAGEWETFGPNGEFVNLDVNCNGNNGGDVIIGLDSVNLFQGQWVLGTNYNNVMPLPVIKIEYVWMRFYENDDPNDDGDGVVDFANQWIHVFQSNSPSPFGITYVNDRHWPRGHDDEHEDFYSVMRGLDEPDVLARCYSIKDTRGDIWLHGFTTPRTTDNLRDDEGRRDTDRFTFKADTTGKGFVRLDLNFNVGNLGAWNMQVLEGNTVKAQMSRDNRPNDGILSWATIRNTTYQVLFSADADANSYSRPYRFQVYSAPAPNLIVSSASVSPVQVAQGANVNITYTIQNPGSAQARASQTGFFLSRDNQYSANDDVPLRLGNDLNQPENAINAGGQAVHNGNGIARTIPANTAPNTYYIIVYADITNTENNESDEGGGNGAQWRATQQITVTAPPRPNLIVSAASVAPVQIAPGANVTITYRIQNTGNAQARASQTGFFLSRDAVKSDDDVPLRLGDVLNQPENALNAGAQIDRNNLVRTIPANTAPNTYYIIVYADITNAENNESDEAGGNGGQWRASQQITVTGRPNLIVSAVSVAPVQMAPGANVTINYSIRNIGNAQARASQTGFFLSRDAVKSDEDVPLNPNQAEGALNAGAQVDRNAVRPIPANTAPNTYYIIVYADITNAENNESDEAGGNGGQWRASQQITVTPPPRPNLIVSVVSVAPVQMAPGANVTITYRIQNIGNAQARASQTGFFLSRDAVKSDDDVPLRLGNDLNQPENALNAGAQIDRNNLVRTIPANTAPNTYYIIVYADITNAENNESDEAGGNGGQWRASQQITVQVARREVVILNEGFQGNFPGDNWRLAGDPTWDDEFSNAEAYAGGWFGWCAGSNRALADRYVNNMNATMTYGPFDLSNAVSGNFEFRWKFDTEINDDWCYYELSTDNANFTGFRSSGAAWNWARIQGNFQNFGNRNWLGQRQVWIRFKFTSDWAVVARGMCLDDIIIKKTINGMPPQDGEEDIGGHIMVLKPQEFSVGEAYPNPFNSTTLITLDLPESEMVTGILFDISGREIRRVVEGELSVGHHEITIQGDNLQTGVYFLRIQTSKGHTASRKVMLTR